jgi:hypothetical protein
MLVMLLAASAGSALADKYEGGPAAGYQRPAMLVRAKEKDVAWARTIQSGLGGTHIVAWKVRGSTEVRTTFIDSKGKLLTKPLVSPNGRVVGLTSNGRSAIVAIESNGKPARYVLEKVGFGGTLPAERVQNARAPRGFLAGIRALYRQLRRP